MKTGDDNQGRDPNGANTKPAPRMTKERLLALCAANADDRSARLAERHDFIIANREAAEAQDRAWEADQLFRRWVELSGLPVELAQMTLDGTEVSPDQIVLRFRHHHPDRDTP